MSEIFRITDVAPTLYVNEETKRPLESVEQIQEDLWTWWAEADLRPSPIRLFVEGRHLNDKYHNDLVAQAKAAAVIRKGRIERGRVEAETRGVEALRDLLISLESKDGVVYLSPPGSKEEGFGEEGRRRLSFTYLYHVGNAGRIHFLAIPELEIPVWEQLRRVEDLIDEDKTKGIVSPRDKTINDRTLVSHPFIVRDKNSLNLIAQKLGYKNLMDLWRSALEAKRLRGKVGELIKHVSQDIWDAYMSQDLKRLEVLGDVFRGVTSLIVAKGLEDVSDVDKYFDDKVAAILASKNIGALGGVTYSLLEPYYEDLHEFYWRLKSNDRAMDIMEGGACPGDRGLGFELGLDKFGEREVSNNVMLDVIGARSPFEYKEKGESSSELADGEKACYPCPLCGGEVRRQGSELVCQSHPAEHHIKYQSQAD